ncbi:cupin domain-containing protein [Paenibacillus aceris]|uniref:Mannose-6-phosphate isomerase-like protein (Cupin superfamily) n=1 Tax=Paenibacillus aceris TaxID=869555 RepID=A0ABS4HUP6_9BACL|nr:cupin domain-containing protein [Paenibacillus aceris]MBP1962337.1 mannose-6-phosphate isomerase-like protein (cupin superfamily) [Paenibacillus aceris]NHW37157.1 cupin domain-containing protein [Paenibacillus aceris]
MIKLRLSELQDTKNGHILQGVLPGDYLSSGGLSFAKRGERSHTNDGPDGRDYHIHGDCEAFLILQGTGTMEINGEHFPVTTGDIVIVEPGEDHHLNSSEADPIVTVWCHASSNRHKNQQQEESV